MGCRRWRVRHLDWGGFLMDTPLAGLLHFLCSSMPISPEEMVDELLAKVYSVS
jgi:hypothetical protein